MKDYEEMKNYLWKNQNGSTKKLVEMPYEDLQRAYNHTTDMLWNTVPSSIGKTKVKLNIKKAVIACNAELLLRYLLKEMPIDAFKTNWDIINYIKARKEADNLKNTDSVSTLFTGLSNVYSNVTIDDLMDACFDKLECINRKMISDKFILSQGIWLTKEEKEELTEIDEETNERRSFMDVIKERLFLNNVRLRVDPKGFSYAEFRALIKMAPMTKISSLPSKTLEILRDKVLLLLDAETDKQIARWTNLMQQIEEVADYKHFMLKKKEY